MSAMPDAVTELCSPRTGLPLHERVETVRRRYFYCSTCRREQRFGWTSAYCTEAGELLCFSCSYERRRRGDEQLRLCRQCRQPRHVLSDFPYPACSQTVCNGCRIEKKRQPLPCGHCGKPFTPKRSDARYCSGRCRTAAHRCRTNGGAA